MEEKKILPVNKNKIGLFSNKNTRIRNLIFLIVPFFVLMCALIVFTILSVGKLSNNLSEKKATSNANEIEGMNIYLRDNATELQKDLFSQLKQAYKDGNDEEAAMLTAESFIADLYTWTNKYGSYDVGGIYYYADRYNLEQYGRDTFYKYLSHYIDEYGSENLLEVVSIESHGGLCDSKYTIDESGKSYDYYFFDVRWQYANHPNFTDKEFSTSCNVKVIKSDIGRFEVVEAYD